MHATGYLDSNTARVSITGSLANRGMQPDELASELANWLDDSTQHGEVVNQCISVWLAELLTVE